MKTFRLITAVICLAFILGAAAQPQKRLYEISVYPENGEWTEAVNKNVKFVVNLTKSNIPYGDFDLSYEISEDMMSPRRQGKVTLKNGRGVISGVCMVPPLITPRPFLSVTLPCLLGDIMSSLISYDRSKSP